jgi:hypothetical protein
VLASFDDTIAALMPDWPVLSPDVHAAVLARCTEFVRAQLRLAPFHVRIGFWVLFTSYRIYALLRTGPAASRSAQAAALTAFSSLPLPMVTGPERILRSMTVLVFFEDAAVLAALSEDTLVARQEGFRARRAAALDTTA